MREKWRTDWKITLKEKNKEPHYIINTAVFMARI